MNFGASASIMWNSVTRWSRREEHYGARSAQGPRGELLYAVGDIHGRADLLAELIAKIHHEAPQTSANCRPVIAFLGDYIDRGPNSHDVIEQILRLKAQKQFSVHTLRGNHDQFLLDFLEGGRGGRLWLAHGGAETLRSYGVEVPSLTDDKSLASASERLREAMSFAHRMFFKRTRLSLEFGEYFLAHAGVRPGIALQDQVPDDLMSIRKEFLRHPEPAPGRTVVFGHTPFLKPLFEFGKIGIDTGAYATGVLTALRIFEDKQILIQT